MCHLILAMPLLGLVVFWFWPLSIAGPAYAGIVALSAWLYLLIIKAMRRPVVSGKESLMHSRGTVLGRDGKLFRVRANSEIWNAASADRLSVGESVEVIGIDGLILNVRRLAYEDFERARHLSVDEMRSWR